jgi:hypothetical protein
MSLDVPHLSQPAPSDFQTSMPTIAKGGPGLELDLKQGVRICPFIRPDDDGGVITRWQDHIDFVN